MSKNLFKDRALMPPNSVHKPKPKHRNTKKNNSERHVTFAEQPTYYPHQNLHIQPTYYDTNSPEYRLWMEQQAQQAQIQQQQQQAQIHMQQVQAQQLRQNRQSDTESNTSTETSVSTSSSEITYSSEDLG